MHDMYKYRPCWSVFHVMDAFVLRRVKCHIHRPFPFVGMDANIVVVVVIATISPVRVCPLVRQQIVVLIVVIRHRSSSAISRRVASRHLITLDSGAPSVDLGAPGVLSETPSVGSRTHHIILFQALVVFRDGVLWDVGTRQKVEMILQYSRHYSTLNRDKA